MWTLHCSLAVLLLLAAPAGSCRSMDKTSSPEQLRHEWPTSYPGQGLPWPPCLHLMLGSDPGSMATQEVDSEGIKLKFSHCHCDPTMPLSGTAALASVVFVCRETSAATSAQPCDIPATRQGQGSAWPEW